MVQQPPRGRAYPNPALLVLLPVLAFGTFALVLRQRENQNSATGGPGLAPKPSSNSLNPPAYSYIDNSANVNVNSNHK